MKNTTTSIIIIAIAAAAVVATGCGFKPPREFNNVAKADPATIEQIPASNDVCDGGADAGEDAVDPHGHVPIALGFTTVGGITFEKLLGRTEDEISVFLTATEPGSPEEEEIFAKEADEGRLRYANHLQLKIEDGVVVSLTQQVPSDLDCDGAADWMGFAGAKKTQTDSDGMCKWSPGGLGESIEGEMDPKTDMFSATVVAPAETTE